VRSCSAPVTILTARRASSSPCSSPCSYRCATFSTLPKTFSAFRRTNMRVSMERVCGCIVTVSGAQPRGRIKAWIAGAPFAEFGLSDPRRRDPIAPLRCSETAGTSDASPIEQRSAGRCHEDAPFPPKNLIGDHGHGARIPRLPSRRRASSSSPYRVAAVCAARIATAPAPVPFDKDRPRPGLR
jgi:hypothetical protein